METIQPLNPRERIGANNPPPDPPKRDPLLIQYDDRISAAQDWEKIKEVASAEQAAKLSAFLQQLDGTHKALDEQRKAEGRAFTAQQDLKYKEPLAALLIAKGTLKTLERAWLAREQAKVDEANRKAQEAARQAEEAAAAALKKAEEGGIKAALAAQKAADESAQAKAAAEDAPTRARVDAGAFGGRTVSQRTTWYAEITNLSKALNAYKKDPTVLKAIEDAILSAARKDAVKHKDPTKAPEGVRFFSRTE